MAEGEPSRGANCPLKIHNRIAGVGCVSVAGRPFGDRLVLWRRLASFGNSMERKCTPTSGRKDEHAPSWERAVCGYSQRSLARPVRHGSLELRS